MCIRDRQEAARLGFRRAVVPRGSGVSCSDLALQEASGVAEALVAALGVNPANDG